MSNLAGKAYGMNVVTPMRPGMTWINNFLFMISRSLPSTLSGLLGLGFIHFARWVLIRRDQWPQLGQPPANLSNDYMLFCSNFNGTWNQYIDAFADGVPGGLDLFWYSSTKYPNSIPITPFKNHIRANQIDTNYYYNATPAASSATSSWRSSCRTTLPPSKPRPGGWTIQSWPRRSRASHRARPRAWPLIMRRPFNGYDDSAMRYQLPWQALATSGLAIRAALRRLLPQPLFRPSPAANEARGGAISAGTAAAAAGDPAVLRGAALRVRVTDEDRERADHGAAAGQ
jgi:hypothetical protein